MFTVTATVIGYFMLGLLGLILLAGMSLAVLAFAKDVCRLYRSSRMYKRLEKIGAINDVKCIWIAIQVLKRYDASKYKVSEIEELLTKYSSHRNIKPEELNEILNSAKINKQ